MQIRKVLGIISILGFAGIIIEALIDFSITPWVQSALFLLIGLALFTAGGYNMFFDYFKDGLSIDELNKVVTVIVGFLSVILGLLLIFNVDLSAFDGIKIIISFIAIFIISFETWGAKQK